jgi:hypothetical protein
LGFGDIKVQGILLSSTERYDYKTKRISFYSTSEPAETYRESFFWHLFVA